MSGQYGSSCLSVSVWMPLPPVLHSPWLHSRRALARIVCNLEVLQNTNAADYNNVILVSQLDSDSDDLKVIEQCRKAIDQQSSAAKRKAALDQHRAAILYHGAQLLADFTFIRDTRWNILLGLLSLLLGLAVSKLTAHFIDQTNCTCTSTA